jgi:hypothetical protein
MNKCLKKRPALTLTLRFSPPFCHQPLTHEGFTSLHRAYPSQKILASVGFHDVPVRSGLHGLLSYLD